MGNTFQKMVSSDPFPPTDSEPTFDPMYGFPKERKQRVMPLSEEDMIAAKIPLDCRDYCAHLYLEYKRCFIKKFPFIILCAEEIQNYKECQHEDDVLRAKEYERERRLLIRERRKQQRTMEAVTA
ncbi:NADH dehydrogenase [ubiquinone] 1 beta subcomplex subunit 7 [Bombus pascuorum]|uniref:NADH dehydrogenase [ubiquinone] 1 beta subcomplex subunit 7 n=1 Tax=Bombus pascuorum TaxID=65598 RepID=UPI002146857C|nr:NADH dehydrogenase [ubiquinone] 1 beta subcomplex subunit 7 [Bombus pascuorum]